MENNEHVDTENEILHDVQICLEGEALGHGVYLDRQFIQAVAEAGNARGDEGLKVRYGHPTDAKDDLSSFLGYAKNFRVTEFTRKDGSLAAGVIADIHISPAAHKSPDGDLATHMMELAKSAPAACGQSIVFSYKDFKVLDADGREYYRSNFESYSAWIAMAGDVEEPKVYAVLGELHGTDFTGTPAATEAMFSARLSGLQAKKDKEIAALKKDLEDYRHSAADTLAAKDKEIETFKTSIAELNARIEALMPFEETNKQLTSEIDSLKASLAETQAVAAAEAARYQAQVGVAMQTSEEKSEEIDHRAVMCSLPPAQRQAYYEAHKAEIDHPNK